MKKVFFAAACFAFIAGCQKKSGGFQTYFWCSTKTASQQYLFIDGKEKGVLPYLAQAPACANDNSKQQALLVFLPSGKYEIEIRDEQGKLYYEELLRLKRTVGSMTIGSTENWDGAGSMRTFENDCLIEEIRYDQ
jgi:hypothetical protein